MRLVTGRNVLDEIKEHLVMAHALSCCTASGDEKNNREWAPMRAAWAMDELEEALELLGKVTLDDAPRPSA